MASLVTRSRYPLPFEAVRRDLDRWFEQFFSPSTANGGQEQAWHAPAALWEDSDNYHLEVDLPGVQNQDVDVTFEKGALLVTAERKVPEEERKYWHHDRNYGKLQFKLQMPETVDGEKIDAQLKNGVLHLTFAKRPEAQPKKISVKATE
jgi:HSP20 family protein